MSRHPLVSLPTGAMQASSSPSIRDSSLSLSKPEIEALVSTLSPTLVNWSAYGSPDWLSSHHLPLERLALQSALNVRQGTEEFVSDALLGLPHAVPLLIQDLVLTRAWKPAVLPLVTRHVAKHASVIGYALVQHEATLLHLLQAIMYKGGAALDRAGDALTDLVDVVATCMSYLNSDPPVPDDANGPLAAAGQLMSQSEVDLMQAQKTKIDFECAWHALACLTHLTHHVDQLPLGVLARMVNTKDVLYLLAHVLETRLWERRAISGATQVYVDGQWVDRHGDDVLLVTKCEGLAWMAVANLVLHPEVQRRYEMTEYRRGALLRLVAQFDHNTTLMTQLPFLEPVLRYLLTLQLSSHDPDRPAAHAITASLGVLVESLPAYPPESLIPPSTDLAALARHLKQVWTPDLNRTYAVQLARVYEGELLETLLESQPRCATCGADAEHRCSQCRGEWYCSRKCQVKAWKSHHKQVCTLLASGSRGQAGIAQSKVDAQQGEKEQAMLVEVMGGETA